MKILLSLCFILLFTSCVPQSGGSGGSRQTASVGTNTTTNTTPTFVNTSELYWYGNNTNTLTLNINANNIINFYLRGKRVESFLGYKNTLGIMDNFNSLYCLEIIFNSPLKTMRTRAVPIVYNDYATGKVERLFRVDIDNPTNSSYSCAGTPTPATVVFDATQICPTCVSSQSATGIKIYKSVGTAMGAQVASSGASSLDISGLLLRLDPTNSSTSNNGSCSQSACQTQGYDCCSGGQCVLDGSIKPASLSDTNFLTIIKPSVDNQFSSFTNWPQYYNVCPRIPDPQVTPTPTATPDPGVVSAAQLASLKNDFYCTQELAARSPTTPYNLNDFSSTTFPAALCTGTSTQIDACLKGYRQNFATNGSICNATTTLNYLEVMKRVYSMCGCANTNWTLSIFNSNHPVNTCPYFSLKALTSIGIETSTEALIANVQCTVGDPNPTVTPFQNLEVNVPARSAPHRFFKTTDGAALDDITTAFNSSTTPEGTAFSYLDPGTNTIPNNGSFNMNSVLGQFSVDLTGAYPAKMIKITYDSTYVISAISGYYTPCPNCMRDSWFQTFSAHPASQGGLGVGAVGFSTSRDTFDGNTSAANYEDNIWGRACFVPPTMLPFSHKSYGTTAAQRQNRLTAQAAMYINGYQRDWYGFNKGALIGSFDGVTWFAIGKNRRVRATSSKLFLAINAPFADLATPSTIVASVREDEGIATASAFDYDFSISANDSRQNDGGSCQKYHICDKDSDCITRLGWEYVCGDITGIKTAWPRFDSNAVEIANSTANLSITGILQGGAISGASTKRCIYRGAGAPCSVNYSVSGNGGSNDPNLRRLLSCAPNFYCADKGVSAFNSEVARFATQLEDIPLAANHLYGMDANVLGRPLHYVTAIASLPTVAKDALVTSANLWGITGLNNNIGLCRPGRQLNTTNSTSADIANNHSLKNPGNRTDYVNQIASCDSNSYYAKGRYSNCPVLDAIDSNTLTTNDGNYRIFASSGLAQINFQSDGLSQNACGKESQDTSGVNPFYYIESGILTGTNIVDKTLTKDACFRRPGAVCHSDLDCSPNKLHAEQVDNYAVSYFGGTAAEQSYWRESLICGQASPKPAIGTSTYDSYDLTQNRCCRAIGKDLTIYTQNSTTGTLNVSLIPSTTANWNKTNGRYSRYLTLSGYPNATYPKPDVSSTAALLTGMQWKTVSAAAQNTCCGGGWIRKFADGTHTWPIGSRLNMDINNFKCLNYPTDLAYQKPSDVPTPNYSADYGAFCMAPTATTSNGCIQMALATNSGSSVTAPTLLSPYDATLFYEYITNPTAAWGSFPAINRQRNFSAGVFSAAPTEHMLFPPQFVSYTDGLGNAPSGWSKPEFHTGDARGDVVSFYLPSFIFSRTTPVTSPPRNISGVFLVIADGSLGFQCVLPGGCRQEPGGAFFSTNSTKNWIECKYNGTSDDPCQYSYDSSSGVMTVSHDWDWQETVGKKAEILIRYVPTSIRTGVATLGNDLYYANKLGKFELLGIPQIAFEPLYCSTDTNTLVPELYKQQTRTNFENLSNSFVDTLNQVTMAGDTLNTSKWATTAAQINKSAVFSESEVSCCLKLGSVTTTANNCCSGFAKDGTCMLPAKTDLHVYFNRFISGDGIDPAGPGGGLVDADFDTNTGEPKISANSKLYSLGTIYCSDGVRQGAAFGKYKIEPTPPITVTDNLFYSIVDSYSDIDSDQDDERGAAEFVAGFRWNHHLYCK